LLTGDLLHLVDILLLAVAVAETQRAEPVERAVAGLVRTVLRHPVMELLIPAVAVGDVKTLGQAEMAGQDL